MENTMIKTCKFCGDKFKTTNRRKKFCNYTCGRRDWRLRRNPPSVKRCKFCQEYFSTTDGRKIFCNGVCRSRFYNDCLPSYVRKNCEFCKKEFIPKRKNQKYCNPRCAKRKENKTKKEKRRERPLVFKPCRHCRKQFPLLHPNKKFCSPECFSNHHYPERGVRTCPTCGGAFDTKKGAQKYCSPECRKERSRQYFAELYKQAKLKNPCFLEKKRQKYHERMLNSEYRKRRREYSRQRQRDLQSSLELVRESGYIPTTITGEKI